MTINVSLGEDVSLAFGVPLLVRSIPEAGQHNPGLARLILAREAESKGITKSNSGGWHSEETLMNWPEPEIAALRGWIDAGIQRICRTPYRKDPSAVDIAYRATGWANVNRHGDYNSIHIHSGSHWAVVYYVSVGEEEPGHSLNGQLELRDPRPAAGHGRLPGFMFGRAITVLPRPGTLVVFPAWLEHWVHPFYGKGERISVAVNIDITKFEVRGDGQARGSPRS
jgi:uncharacterized protein (TIGR02466 family)